MSEKLKQNIIPILLFLAVFGLYLSTAPPGATNYADSSELITASYTLGIPHPPGYPLFVLIGKLFSYIPVGEIAFRYSIMTSAFGAATVVLVYLTLLKVFSRSQKVNSEQRTVNSENSKHLIYAVVPALVGALSLAFSYMFWLYSIVPEVFALSNFFAAMIIFLGISWYFDAKVKSQKSKVKSKFRQKLESFVGTRDYYPVLIAITSSLGFLAHQLIVFLAPALLYLIWLADRKLFIPTKRWFKVLGGFALGLLPVIYFPIVSYFSNPVIDFGNVTSVRALWDLLSRKLYANASPTGNAYLETSLRLDERINEIPRYIGTLNESFVSYVFLLAVLGAVYIAVMLARGKGKNINYFLGLAYLFTGLTVAMYTAMGPKWADAGYNLLGVHPRMYLLGFVTLAFLIGIGARQLLLLVKKSKFLSVPIIALLLLAAPFYQFSQNYAFADKSDFYLGEDYAYNLFANIESDAIFFVRGDMPSFAAFYYQYTRGERPDVTLIPLSLPDWQQRDVLEQHPELWDTESDKLELIVRDIVKDNIDKRPIYFTGLPADEIHLLGLAGNPYNLSPRGLIQQVTKDFDPRSETDWYANYRFRNSNVANDHYDWFAKEVVEQYIIGRFNSFSWYLRYGYNDLAQKELAEMRRIDPGHDITEKAIYKFGAEGGKERDAIEPDRSDEKLKREAFSFLKQQMPYGALGNFLYLSEKNPENIDLRLEIAKIFAGLGWIEEAEREFDRILEIDPEHERTKEIIRQWELIK